MDWDEEFALQDFLKNELAERNCRELGGQTGSKPEEAVDKLTDRGEEEDGEEKWMVVDTGGEGEVRDTSTPLSALSAEAQPGHGAAGGGESGTPGWTECPPANIEKHFQLLSKCFNFFFLQYCLTL